MLLRLPFEPQDGEEVLKFLGRIGVLRAEEAVSVLYVHDCFPWGRGALSYLAFEQQNKL